MTTGSRIQHAQVVAASPPPRALALLRRSARRAAPPGLVWAAFYPLFADLLGVPWLLGAPLGYAAFTLAVARFERRGHDTAVVVTLGTVAVLFLVLVLATIAAALIGIPALFRMGGQG